ncbi:MAG: methyltransferase [Aigarchaeota archaeon]|nr:methyltransferase [Candidatus Pelearchaeum maunauluense]
MELAGLDDERERLRKIFAKHGFVPNPLLDQHFLLSSDVASRLVEVADVGRSDVVLDLGAGHGNITLAASRRAGKVLALEKDRRLIPILRENVATCDNVVVISADFLKAQLPHFSKLVSNPPYSLAEALLNRLIRRGVAGASLLFPEPLARRLTAKPGSQEETLLTYKVRLAYDVVLHERVRRYHFYPETEHDAVIVALKPASPSYTSRFMLSFLRQTDKKTRNALRNTLQQVKGLSKREATRAVELSPLDDSILQRWVARLSLKQIRVIEETFAAHA